MTNLVFADLETTGLNQERCEIWEVGAIVRRPDEPDVEYCWQIRPTLVDAEPAGLRIGRYYERSRLIHHLPGSAHRTVHPNYARYDQGATERHTTETEVAGELAPLLDGAYLVGAVPWFDERFLQRFLADNGQAATNHYHLVDVETLAAGVLCMPPPWNFDELLAAFGLAYDEADRHTALGDARLARDLYDAVLVRGAAMT